MVGDLATFRLVRNPDQDAYRFCTCLEGYFGRAVIGKCQECPAAGQGGATECKDGSLRAKASWPVLKVNATDGTTYLTVVPCPADRTSSPCNVLLTDVQPTSMDEAYIRGLLMNNTNGTSSDPSKSLCSPGHESRLCSKCSQGYYRSGRSCLKCRSDRKSLPYWLLPTAAIFVQGLLGVKVLGQGDTVRSGLFRTLVLHFQLFAALPRSLEISLPDGIRSVFQGTEQGTSLQLEGLECAEKGWDGFFGPFAFACFLPVCLVIASPILAALSTLWEQWKGKDRAHTLSLRSKALLGASYLWLVLVFGSSRRILSALNCTKYGSSFQRDYVATAMWVSCDRSHGDYAAVFAVAVILGPAFVVATVALLMRTLLSTPRPLSSPPSALRSFLEAPYRPEVSWWELVQSSRRLILSILQALVPFQSATLPVLITLLLTTSLAIHTWIKPFRKRIDNAAESVSLSLLLGTYMVGLVLANPSFRFNDRKGTDFAGWLVVVLNLAFLFALFLGLFSKYAITGYRKGRQAMGSDTSKNELLLLGEEERS